MLLGSPLCAITAAPPPPPCLESRRGGLPGALAPRRRGRPARLRCALKVIAPVPAHLICRREASGSRRPPAANKIKLRLGKARRPISGRGRGAAGPAGEGRKGRGEGAAGGAPAGPQRQPSPGLASRPTRPRVCAAQQPAEVLGWAGLSPPGRLGRRSEGSGRWLVPLGAPRGSRGRPSRPIQVTRCRRRWK